MVIILITCSRKFQDEKRARKHERLLDRVGNLWLDKNENLKKRQNLWNSTNVKTVKNVLLAIKDK